MNSKNEDNNNNDEKDIEKKEIIINNISNENKKNEKDKSTEKKEKESNEKIYKENFNNNIIPLNEDKEKKIEEKNTEKEKSLSKKVKTRRVPIKNWPCRSLNEYKIINDPVGKGSYGIVYKAYYIGKEEYRSLYGIPDVVALKQIKTEKEKEGFPITALREIMILKELDHKNILKLLEVVVSEPKKEKKIEEGKINRDVYLVFEYMEQDLGTILQRKIDFDLSQIKYIFHELVLGLKYLHENNILHRDLKPLNILLNAKNEIKIGDFGLARIFSNSPNVKKIYTNQVVTVCYRAPELLLGETNYSTKIDIWSLGCILLELLTRKTTFSYNEEKLVFLSICELCGTPNEKNWPHVTELKNYDSLIPKEEKASKINNTTFPNFDDVTLDIIKKILTLNPEERITLDEILKHPFLTSHEPKMCKAEDMPKIEEEMHWYRYREEMKKMEIEQQKQIIGKSDYNRKNEKSFLGNKRKKKS